MSSWTRGPAVLDRSDLISIRPGLLQSCSPQQTSSLTNMPGDLRVVTLASVDTRGQNPSKQTNGQQVLLLVRIEIS